MQEIYEPAEDSFLLKKFVAKHSNGTVLDMGTGSGIQAFEAARRAKKVIAVDINKEAITKLQRENANKKILFQRSDLFQIFKNKKIGFDTIVFNAPYLPKAKEIDISLDGGKKGYETIVRFLDDASGYLKPNGIILLVLSSFSKKEKVDEAISRNMLEHKELAKQHVFFEDLYVYLIAKSDMLKQLEKKGVTKVKYYAKGKRGFVYTGFHKGKKIVIKIKNPGSEAVGRIQNELRFLKQLNKERIGPRLLFSGKNFLCYEFVEGEFFPDYLRHAAKRKITKAINQIFEQLFRMDKLGINKEEMAHPVKHILIRNNKPVLIDFERAHRTLKPANVTQFCSFLISGFVAGLLRMKGITLDKDRMIGLAKEYKEKLDKESLNCITREIK